MYVRVSTMTGTYLQIDVKLTTTILEIKQEVSRITGARVASMEFLFGGRKLRDTATVDDYNIQEGSTLDQTTRFASTSS